MTLQLREGEFLVVDVLLRTLALLPPSRTGDCMSRSTAMSQAFAAAFLNQEKGGNQSAIKRTIEESLNPKKDYDQLGLERIEETAKAGAITVAMTGPTYHGTLCYGIPSSMKAELKPFWAGGYIFITEEEYSRVMKWKIDNGYSIYETARTVNRTSSNVVVVDLKDLINV